jgi:hypothetical protein
MASKANLVIDQGSTFSVKLSLLDDVGDPIHLSGFVAQSQIRKWYASLSPSATFSTEIDVENATITLSLTAEQTANMESGRYVYDVEIVDGDSVSRVVEGIVTVTPQVTK